jgi:hypothetical protein
MWAAADAQVLLRADGQSASPATPEAAGGPDGAPGGARTDPGVAALAETRMRSRRPCRDSAVSLCSSQRRTPGSGGTTGPWSRSPKRAQISYSECRIGKTVSYSFQHTATSCARCAAKLSWTCVRCALDAAAIFAAIFASQTARQDVRRWPASHPSTATPRAAPCARVQEWGRRLWPSCTACCATSPRGCSSTRRWRQRAAWPATAAPGRASCAWSPRSCCPLAFGAAFFSGA